MTTGELSERISVICFETTRNSKGDIVKGAEVLRCNVWAKVQATAGKIEDITPAREVFITYKVTIRYRNDILPDDLIKWRGKDLEMITPPTDTEGKRKWVEFYCKERIKDGAGLRC